MDPLTTPSRWRSPLGIFMLIAGALGLYYLLTEHLTTSPRRCPTCSCWHAR